MKLLGYWISIGLTTSMMGMHLFGDVQLQDTSWYVTQCDMLELSEHLNATNLVDPRIINKMQQELEHYPTGDKTKTTIQQLEDAKKLSPASAAACKGIVDMLRRKIEHEFAMAKIVSIEAKIAASSEQERRLWQQLCKTSTPAAE